MELLNIDTEKTADIMIGFIQDRFSQAGFENAVLGLSGGIDSSTTAYLAQKALGAGNVYGINMPYRSSSPESANDAKLVADELGINYITVEITDMVDSYFKMFPDASRLRRGNRMARERMCILYDQSAALSGLVIGSGNKTELLLGYCTLHGDMACAIDPIGDLYKTQLRHVARYLGVPDRIIEKAPTADLWPGQSDESELGFTYEKVDKILYLMVEKKCNVQELEKMGFEKEFIQEVTKKMMSSHHKRCPTPVPKVNFSLMDEMELERV
ncbi:NAD+ synthase [Candidatus Poribacteria bacterium]|nr:NAD+ synthase [Candidatus Poribacteria bacterium]